MPPSPWSAVSADFVLRSNAGAHLRDASGRVPLDVVDRDRSRDVIETVLTALRVPRRMLLQRLQHGGGDSVEWWRETLQSN